MQLAQLKKTAIYSMIGSLVAAAGVAVIAVLIGEFNDVLGRALFTLLIVTLHALICLGFLDTKEKTSHVDDLKFFTNTIFVIIVLSFVTAVFGTWNLLPGEIVAKLYGTYFVAAFAILHGEMLYKTTGLNSRINNLVYGNYVFMGLVVLLLLPLIWLASSTEFAEFYYRLLAAAAIIDATMTILAVILHRLYLQKHPELKSPLFTKVVYAVDAEGKQIPQTVEAPRRRVHPLLIILGLFLALQFIAPILFLVGALFAG